MDKRIMIILLAVLYLFTIPPALNWDEFAFITISLQRLGKLPEGYGTFAGATVELSGPLELKLLTGPLLANLGAFIISLFGMNAEILHFFPVMAALCCAFYTSRLVKEKKLEASLLLFSAPAFLFMSRHYMSDIFLTFFITAALYYLREGRSRPAGIFSALAVLTRYEGLALLPVLALDVRKKRRWEVIAIPVAAFLGWQLLTFLSYGTFHIISTYNLVSAGGMPWISEGGVENISLGGIVNSFIFFCLLLAMMGLGLPASLLVLRGKDRGILLIYMVLSVLIAGYSNLWLTGILFLGISALLSIEGGYERRFAAIYTGIILAANLVQFRYLLPIIPLILASSVKTVKKREMRAVIVLSLLFSVPIVAWADMLKEGYRSVIDTGGVLGGKILYGPQPLSDFYIKLNPHSERFVYWNPTNCILLETIILEENVSYVLSLGEDLFERNIRQCTQRTLEETYNYNVLSWRFITAGDNFLRYFSSGKEPEEYLPYSLHPERLFEFQVTNTFSIYRVKE